MSSALSSLSSTSTEPSRASPAPPCRRHPVAQGTQTSSTRRARAHPWSSSRSDRVTRRTTGSPAERSHNRDVEPSEARTKQTAQDCGNRRHKRGQNAVLGQGQSTVGRVEAYEEGGQSH